VLLQISSLETQGVEVKHWHEKNSKYSTPFMNIKKVILTRFGLKIKNTSSVPMLTLELKQKDNMFLK